MGLIEMDCEWKFKSQTLKFFFAECTNQKEFFSCTRIKHMENEGTIYKTCNKKNDLQKKEIGN